MVLLCLGTQTLCGRNEHPKHDANLTIYVHGLKPGPNDLQMTSNSIVTIPFFGKLTYVLKENDTKNIMGIPKIYNVDRNENQQMATG